MLLIHCPYCDEDRPELEFAYGGEAHIARPADPSQLDRRGVARLPLHPHQPEGLHFERWRHIHGCGASSTRCATPSATSSSRPTRRASRGPTSPALTGDAE